MRKYYDIAVVGGGPIGSYTARRLAEHGFSVCVIEKKRVIGSNILCTGIVSKDSFRRYDLPEDSIMNQIKSFVFVSPSGQRLHYNHPETFAYVLDRSVFDRRLAERARRSGAEYYLGSSITSIEPEKKIYRLTANGKYWQSRAVILATGVNYNLQRKLGFGSPAQFLYGSQVELPLRIAKDSIEVHVGQRYVPNSFAWPVARGRTRVGMIIEKKGKEFLRRFINQRLKYHGAVEYYNEIAVKPIAYGTIKKSVLDRILVVGEAAGQVKTTTGGGIFMGLLCSDIAVERLIENLKKGRSINDYEITWRSVLSGELEVGRRVRQLASRLDDRAIERLFSFVKYNHFWVSLLIPRINFDFHSDLFYYCLKGFSILLKNT